MPCGPCFLQMALLKPPLIKDTSFFVSRTGGCLEVGKQLWKEQAAWALQRSVLGGRWDFSEAGRGQQHSVWTLFSLKAASRQLYLR